MDPGLAALTGAFLGLSGALLISALERRAAARTERLRAFAGYLGALYPAVAELQEMPPNPQPNAVERLVDQLQSDATRFVRTRKQLAAMGNHHLGRIDRLSGTVAVVQMLDMPAEVVSAFDEANDYLERLGNERTDKVKAEWPSIHKELHEGLSRLKAEAKPWPVKIAAKARRLLTAPS